MHGVGIGPAEITSGGQQPVTLMLESVGGQCEGAGLAVKNIPGWADAMAVQLAECCSERDSIRAILA